MLTAPLFCFYNSYGHVIQIVHIICDTWIRSPRCQRFKMIMVQKDPDIEVGSYSFIPCRISDLNKYTKQSLQRTTDAVSSCNGGAVSSLASDHITCWGREYLATNSGWLYLCVPKHVSSLWMLEDQPLRYFAVSSELRTVVLTSPNHVWLSHCPKYPSSGDWTKYVPLAPFQSWDIFAKSTRRTADKFTRLHSTSQFLKPTLAHTLRRWFRHSGVSHWLTSPSIYPSWT